MMQPSAVKPRVPFQIAEPIITQLRTVMPDLTDDDAGGMTFILAVICAQHIRVLKQSTAEPLWGYVIAPPSSGKTEMVRPFMDWDLYVYPTSNISPNALISGYEDEEGSDPSLLNRIQGKVLLLKDLTDQMSQDPRYLDALLGHFRDAYDGDHRRDTGVVGRRGGACDFAMLACCTPELDDFSESHQQLGERFLSVRLGRRLRPSLADRITALSARQRIAHTKIQARRSLAEFTKSHLSSAFAYWAQSDPLPALTPEALHWVSTTASLISDIRTAPTARKRTAEAEGPDRLHQQFDKLLRAHAMLYGRIPTEQSDYEFIARIAHDTIPSHINRALARLYANPDGYDLNELSVISRCDGTALTHRTAQMRHLGIIETAPGTTRLRMTDEYRHTLGQISYFPPNLYPFLNVELSTSIPTSN